MNHNNPNNATSVNLLPMTRIELVREFRAWKLRTLLTSVVSTIFLALFIAAFYQEEHAIYAYKIGGYNIGFCVVFFFGVIVAVSIQSYLLRFIVKRRFSKIHCPNCKKNDAKFWTSAIASGICPHCDTRVISVTSTVTSTADD